MTKAIIKMLKDSFSSNVETFTNRNVQQAITR